MIALSVALILVGFILLTVSAEYLVMGTVAIANKLKVPTLIIGLTVVAFGTSAPEFVVSIRSALNGSYGISLGNVIGSNIANIALILGLTALIRPIVSKYYVFAADYVFLFFATILLTVFCFIGHIAMWQGLLFLLIMAAFIYFNYRHSLKEDKVEETESPIKNRPWWFIIMVTIFGLSGVIFGADVLVTGAVDMARFLGVSETIIGLTIVAVGTSLPELATSIIAALRKQNDIALGNIIGSNIWNILFIIGSTTSIINVEVPLQLIKYDIWVMLFVTVLFLYFIGFQRKIDRKAGALLLLVYVLYITSQVLIVEGTFRIV